MTETSIEAEIARLLQSDSERDLIEGVKNVVGMELRSLDSSAQVTTTEHFNHSYMPDFVLDWKDASGRSSRPVYLRFDLREIGTRRDLDRLPAGTMFLGLRDGAEVGRDFEFFRERATAASAEDTLVTDSSALAAFSDVQSSPLTDVLKSNVVRGAKGLVDASVADSMTRAAEIASGVLQDGSQGEVSAFLDEVNEHFEPAAATRLRRTAQLLHMGLTGDLSALDGEDGLVVGRLSDVELATLIPYLLRNADPKRNNVGFWRHLGSMLGLDRLVALGAQLEDLDVTPFISANSDRFHASRVRWEFGASDESVYGWRLSRNQLKLASSYGALQFADDARALRAEARSTTPTWETVRSVFGAHNLTSVTLSGASRVYTIAARDDSSVKEDCDAWNDSSESTLFVTALTVESPAGSLSVDFVGGVADARPRESLNFLVQSFVPLLAASQGLDAPSDWSPWLYLHG